jgi:hypothetical protein
MTNIVIGKLGRSNVYACPGGFRVGRSERIMPGPFYGSMTKSEARQFRKAAHRAGYTGLAAAGRVAPLRIDSE